MGGTHDIKMGFGEMLILRRRVFCGVRKISVADIPVACAVNIGRWKTRRVGQETCSSEKKWVRQDFIGLGCLYKR